MAKGSIGANGVLKLVSRSEEGLEESEVKLSNFATWLKSIQHKPLAQFFWQSEPITLSNMDWPWGRHETDLLRKAGCRCPALLLPYHRYRIYSNRFHFAVMGNTL
ncbi:hypothetical protein [Nitrosovibrio sp. Nv4]|uniref:hypothetical protein n=1 Tax=Nitrosovibrio sp. Nv4 TaxID=1945880 RepID=UPI000BDDEB7A|nr:hypothetical protein [Nitrosovibrio sp. Nv4]SOD42575.1 hypothetical protein SAMN06298226_2923 [Nitrosovibrio sp. Nv4]